MKNNLLIGLGVIVALLLAFPFGMLLSLGFWVYLGVTYRKKKSVFHEEIEPELAKKLMKRLKILSIIAGVSCIIGVAGIIIHNVLSGPSGNEEYISFFIGIAAAYIFILATAGGLLTFIKGSKKEYTASPES